MGLRRRGPLLLLLGLVATALAAAAAAADIYAACRAEAVGRRRQGLLLQWRAGLQGTVAQRSLPGQRQSVQHEGNMVTLMQAALAIQYMGCISHSGISC